jgi:hypothetical protein
VPAFDPTLESLADRTAGDIDTVPGLEQIHGNGGPYRKFLILWQVEFSTGLLWSDSKPQLNCSIPIPFHRFGLNNRTGPCF